MSDLLMTEQGDGGELVIHNGDIVLDETFYTAVYQSLFEGGNFYNVLESPESETLQQEDFESALNCIINRQNLGHLESVVNSHLDWMIQQGLAQSIETTAKGIENNSIKVNIVITEPDGDIGTYSIIWDREKSMLKKFEVIYGGI